MIVVASTRSLWGRYRRGYIVHVVCGGRYDRGSCTDRMWLVCVWVGDGGAVQCVWRETLWRVQSCVMLLYTVRW